MDDWEYKILDSKDISGSFVFGKTHEHVEEYLNELGSAGWEIISLDFREVSSTRMDFLGVAKRRRIQHPPDATLPAPADEA